jgi:hypothetical protein
MRGRLRYPTDCLNGVFDKTITACGAPSAKNKFGIDVALCSTLLKPFNSGIM